MVLDVGANIGLFSLYIASRARARVVAFEPLAPIRRRLEANLGRYAPQVEVFGIGLSDAEREETFTYYPGYSTFSGIAEYADASGERDVIRRYLSNQGEEGGPTCCWTTSTKSSMTACAPKPTAAACAASTR